VAIVPTQSSSLLRGLRAALFDLDGTLVETRIDFPLMKREVLALAARFGLPSAPLEPLDILGVVEESRRLLRQRGRPEEAEALRREAFRRLEEIEVVQCAAPEPVAGAAELSAALHRRGVAIAIVTRNCRRVSLDLVAAAGLAHDVLVTRDDVPLTKPHPLHLQTALSRLGLDIPAARGPGTVPGSPPSVSAVMVGDHWMDVQAGRNAGIGTVGILRGRDASFFAPALPDLMVDRLADLLPLVS